jgi:putative FmdB family regulatory protein
MPIYEYECQQCHQTTEAMQKFSDPPLTRCPSCSGTLKKLISQSSFHLKGTGWYVTDYARKGASTSEAKPSKGDDTASKAGDSGSGKETGSGSAPSGSASSEK